MFDFSVKAINSCRICAAEIIVLRQRGSRDTCKKCANNIRIKRWKEKNPERKKQLNRESRARNADKRNKYTQEYQKANPEKCRERAKRFRENNPERAREIRRQYYARHREEEIQRVVDRSKRFRTPKWANIDAIAEIYSEARKITEETGIIHHVDHIIPLRSKVVCGLHVETNMQILPYYANIAKGNRFELQ